ncbi:MAG TPA: NAD+ synthase [Thermoleophilaceae bacterium]|nr:NAD+ synthase [Thermoleophilaceae bacterium]
MRFEPLRVALAQMNATVGDIDGNAARIGDFCARARAEGASLVVFPELALTGYPPEDLLLKTHFLDSAGAALERLALEIEGITAIIGFPERREDVYNAAAVVSGGEVRAVYRKMYLPNYGVFDEQRYFQAGLEPALVEVNGAALGLSVCEDIWEPGPPATSEALAGAQVIVNLSASPYHAGKGAERERMLVQRARDTVSIVLFANMVGGQDELVFDGHSVAIDQDGRIVARAPQFAEDLAVCTLDLGAVAQQRLQDPRHRAAVLRMREASSPPVPVLARIRLEQDAGEAERAPSGSAAGGSPELDLGGSVAELMGPEEEVYTALVTGVRDYVGKNGFEQAVVALSGGIDSALVALVAADALGPDRVTCVGMPSRYSSEGTQSDARAIAERLGTGWIEIPIEGLMGAYEEALEAALAGTEPDITEENLQARIRGNIVMALSNKFGWLVLTTGNKSEMSVGYATLYGDMAGGFAVLKDVFKGWVYRLVRWRNAQDGGGAIPESVLDRPPSAELRDDQRDDESLPPYDVLDRILEGYVERDLDARELVRHGLPEDDVARVTRLVDLAEYKRRQAPPGIRISTKAFGRDRRLPITSRYRGGA